MRKLQNTVRVVEIDSTACKMPCEFCSLDFVPSRPDPYQIPTRSPDFDREVDCALCVIWYLVPESRCGTKVAFVNINSSVGYVKLKMHMNMLD